MVNELALRRNAPSLQNNERRNREAGRLPPVLHDSLNIYRPLERSLVSFPQRIRIGVVTAVSRIVEVDSDPGEQRRIVESALQSLKEIYSFGGEEALSEWCRLIQNCGCYLGSAETDMILTGVVAWLSGEVGSSGRDAERYIKGALIRAAKTLADPRMLILLDRDFLTDISEERDCDIRAGIATSLAVIGGRWGVEKAAKIAAALERVEIENPEFILAGCEIGRSSARELELLAKSLERDGNLLWAFPGINTGILDTLMHTPGRIVNSVLKKEGLTEDLSLTLVERRERIGWLSAGLDLRALKHPDKGVRAAAIDRLVDIAADGNYPAMLRKATMKGLRNVASDITVEGFLRLNGILNGIAEDNKLRKEAAMVFLSLSSPGFLKKGGQKLSDDSIVEIGLTLSPYVKRIDSVALEFANGLTKVPGYKVSDVAKRLRDPEVLVALNQFEEVVAAAIAQNFVGIAEKDVWGGCAGAVAKRLQYPYVLDTINQFKGKVAVTVGLGLTYIIHRHLFSEHAIRQVAKSMRNPAVVECINQFEGNTAVGIADVLTGMAYYKWEEVVVEAARTLREYDGDISLMIAKKLLHISKEGKMAIDEAAKKVRKLKGNAAVEIGDELGILVYPFNAHQIEMIARKYDGEPAVEIVNELLNTVQLRKNVGQIAKGMRYPDVMDTIDRFEGEVSSKVAGTLVDIADQKGNGALVETARTLKEYNNRVAMTILERLADIYLAKKDIHVAHYFELTYGLGTYDLESVAKKMGHPDVVETINQFEDEVSAKIAYSLTGITWTKREEVIVEVARTLRMYKDRAAVAIAYKLANLGYSESEAAVNMRRPDVVEIISRFEGDAAVKAANALADIATSEYTLLETVRILRQCYPELSLNNIDNIDEIIESINEQ